MEKCSVGDFEGTDCHKLSYVKTKGLVPISKLSVDEVELLTLRCNENMPAEMRKDQLNLINICLHHKRMYFD